MTWTPEQVEEARALLEKRLREERERTLLELMDAVVVYALGHDLGPPAMETALWDALRARGAA